MKLNDIENKKDLSHILEFFGVRNQLGKAIEELRELQEALLNGDRPDIIEEIADVFIMIEQVKLIFGITNAEIEEVIYYKICRTLSRIESETARRSNVESIEERTREK